jgi:triosephosphate isomerase (TIM)
MKTRTPLIAGNWKMNCGAQDGLDLATRVSEKAKNASNVDVVVAPPATALAAVAATLEELGGRVEVSAQNLYPKDSGAFTGEISAPMIQAAGAKWVILGHSERRAIFGENDAFIREKIQAAVTAGLRPIACIGETLEEREAGKTLDVVFQQVDAFSDLLKADPGHIVIAYEPVWAIGTGKVATPEQAQEVHAAIRGRLAEKVSSVVAEKTRILYGGSVNGSNAATLLGSPDIDGALVGGASLKPDDFGTIIAAAAS